MVMSTVCLLMWKLAVRLKIKFANMDNKRLLHTYFVTFNPTMGPCRVTGVEIGSVVTTAGVAD